MSLTIVLVLLVIVLGLIILLVTVIFVLLIRRHMTLPLLLESFLLFHKTSFFIPLISLKIKFQLIHEKFTLQMTKKRKKHVEL